MRFEPPEPILVALRKHRDKGRLARAEHWSAWGLGRPGATASRVRLLGHIRELFSAPEVNVTRGANEYVLGMDRLQDQVEQEHDAFLLEPGMGPMLYLTSDGRVLPDGRSWDGEELREATDAEAIAALVTGADKTGIKELLLLLPRQPPDGMTCPMCAGERRACPVPRFVEPKIICLVCGGRGWVVQAMLDEAAARGTWPRHD